MTPAEMKQIEPTLAGDYYGGFFTESDSTGDIHKFTVGLAAAAERLGMRCKLGCDGAARAQRWQAGKAGSGQRRGQRNAEL